MLPVKYQPAFSEIQQYFQELSTLFHNKFMRTKMTQLSFSQLNEKCQNHSAVKPKKAQQFATNFFDQLRSFRSEYKNKKDKVISQKIQHKNKLSKKTTDQIFKAKEQNSQFAKLKIRQLEQSNKQYIEEIDKLKKQILLMEGQHKRFHNAHSVTKLSTELLLKKNNKSNQASSSKLNTQQIQLSLSNQLAEQHSPYLNQEKHNDFDKKTIKFDKKQDQQHKFIKLQAIQNYYPLPKRNMKNQTIDEIKQQNSSEINIQKQNQFNSFTDFLQANSQYMESQESSSEFSEFSKSSNEPQQESIQQKYEPQKTRNPQKNLLSEKVLVRLNRDFISNKSKSIQSKELNLSQFTQSQQLNESEVADIKDIASTSKSFTDRKIMPTASYLNKISKQLQAKKSQHKSQFHPVNKKDSPKVKKKKKKKQQ